MDQQLGRSQSPGGRRENHMLQDDCSPVAERLRRIGRDGFETCSHEDSTPPIEEESSPAERRGFPASRASEGLAAIPEVNGGRHEDNVKIDASQMTFLAHMGDFLHRNSTWFLVAALVLLILQDVFGTHGVLAMHRSQKEAAQVQKEIQQLNEENQKLQNRVQSLKSDPATIERIAREEMGLARPGEYIFKIQPKPGEPSTPLAEPAEPPKKP
jgi:cell division protein FtsB